MSKAKTGPPAPDLQHPALSESRPLYINNQGGNTLARALARHMEALRQQQGVLPLGLSIASGFFDLAGFNLLADDLEHVGKVRLLLGAEPLPEAAWRPPGLSDPSEPDFTRAQVGAGLAHLDEGLRFGRDQLPFDARTDAAVRRLLDWLGTGKVEVRRFEDGFLYSRAFLFHVGGGGVVAGPSNFTAAGLPFGLAELYGRLYADFPPYLIYLGVLYHLYGDELHEEEEEEGEIPITNFQKHGIWRARRIMRRYGGALVADGVGLGKTFLAGEIIRQYRERRQRVLLVCPATLRDSTWDQFL